jgi:hypothetical protein
MNATTSPGINERWLKNAQRKHKSIYAPIRAEMELEKLRKPLLAACDAFDVFREFSNGTWSRTPLAILLVFKLRGLLGLRNPELDHPLMNSVLGKLPPDHQFVPDTFTE